MKLLEIPLRTFRRVPKAPIKPYEDVQFETLLYFLAAAMPGVVFLHQVLTNYSFRSNLKTDVNKLGTFLEQHSEQWKSILNLKNKDA